ncbi:MAG: phosphatidylglycerophosphatase A [Alphaproteobacteria bacterium]|nr:phosphatidylglycerophosphatase A [Alphaproteobacteria bacterium]
MKKDKNINFAELIATFFYSGKSKIAPGTVGSFCSLPLAGVAYALGWEAVLIVSILVYLLGIWATNEVLKTSKDKDPGFVVIDETAGQVISFLFVAVVMPFSWLNLCLGFALFRLFDIVKIWPCSFFDKKVVGAFGVMSDDVFAGFYAAVLLLLINIFVL